MDVVAWRMTTFERIGRSSPKTVHCTLGGSSGAQSLVVWEVVDFAKQTPLIILVEADLGVETGSGVESETSETCGV